MIPSPHLAALRRAVGLSQDALAGALRVRRGLVTDLELGRKPLDKAMTWHLAEALKVPAIRVLGPDKRKMPMPTQFSTRMQAERLKAGISARTVGEIIGVRGSAISLYENGRSKPDALKGGSLSVFFGLPIDVLLGPAEEVAPDFSEVEGSGIVAEAAPVAEVPVEMVPQGSLRHTTYGDAPQGPWRYIPPQAHGDLLAQPPTNGKAAVIRPAPPLNLGTDIERLAERIEVVFNWMHEALTKIDGLCTAVTEVSRLVTNRSVQVERAVEERGKALHRQIGEVGGAVRGVQSVTDRIGRALTAQMIAAEREANAGLLGKLDVRTVEAGPYIGADMATPKHPDAPNYAVIKRRGDGRYLVVFLDRKTDRMVDMLDGNPATHDECLQVLAEHPLMRPPEP